MSKPARVLDAAGARLDIETQAGQTPRQLALFYGYDDIANHLATHESRIAPDYREAG